MATACVLGASATPGRLSGEAVARLHTAGWTVYPVHPAGGRVAGLDCLRSLAEVPPGVDLLTVYVNADRFVPLLPAVRALRPRQIILNPGADDEAAVAACTAHGLSVRTACTLVLLATGHLHA